MQLDHDDGRTRDGTAVRIQHTTRKAVATRDERNDHRQHSPTHGSPPKVVAKGSWSGTAER